MPAPEPSQKAAVTVSEMADLCEISRSRFYELMKAGVFPNPVQHPSASRPLYTLELIEKCLQIKHTGVGMNGAPVTFNRKLKKVVPPKHKAKPVAKEKPLDPLMEPIFDAVKSLGLTTTPQAVSDAVAALYPTGIAGQEQGDVIRKTFLYLQGKRP